MRRGWLTSALLGALWAFILAVTLAIMLSFASGDAYRPFTLSCLIFGAALGVLLVMRPLPKGALIGVCAGVFAALSLVNAGAIATGIIESDGTVTDNVSLIWRLIVNAGVGALFAWTLCVILDDLPGPYRLTRHEFEHAILRFLTGFGYIFFTAIVFIPFYIMLMTSVKNKAQLALNPLDFSIDLSQGWDLFVGYKELFQVHDFGTYLLNSAFVSVCTVALTLLFAVPGAYAVARLRFKGSAHLSRSILLIYMVPMIVLALPIYIAFSITGLKNTMLGLILIYPVTTIPVALYMLQGYFRGLPHEVEEAGLMDGLNRLQVIWKITLPLSLPALASVSLYVFMIAWNEFLLALLLLDDPGIFTLPRGVYRLDDAEVSSQTLMAGAVVATVPIMALFLGLERFMTKGLTAGSVKG